MLEYSEFKNRFFFFLQEREFLKNYVQRIVDVRPNLVLVEKTVSRIAQDMLLEHGITLVINVKPVSEDVGFQHYYLHQPSGAFCVTPGRNNSFQLIHFEFFLNLASVGQSELCDPGGPCYVHGPAPDQTSPGYLPQVLHAALHSDQQ